MKIRVSLPAMPSAGFQWECEKPERVIGHGLYNPHNNTVGGIVTYFMEVDIETEEKLTFLYRRPWMDKEKPLHRLTIELK